MGATGVVAGDSGSSLREFQAARIDFRVSHRYGGDRRMCYDLACLNDPQHHLDEKYSAFAPSILVDSGRGIAAASHTERRGNERSAVS